MAGGKLRLPPGELVSRSERALAPTASAGLAPDTFSDITRTLNVETVLTGSYVIAGEPANRQIRVDLYRQRRETGSGETVSKNWNTGTVAGTRQSARRSPARTPGSPCRNSRGGGSGEGPGCFACRVPLLQWPRTPPRVRSFRSSRGSGPSRQGRPWGTNGSTSPGHSAWSCWAAIRRRATPSPGHWPATLPAREQQLQIEAMNYRLKPDHVREAEVLLDALVQIYPDELEYRFQAADALSQAGRYQDSLAEIAAMRALPAPLNQDPRIDWADVRTAHRQTDFARRLLSSRRLEEKARQLHSDWLLAEALIREVSPLARANRMAEAAAALKESREIYRRLGDRAGEAFTYRSEGTGAGRRRPCA